MTTVAELKRGDIIWASDPLSAKGRPLLVIGTPQFPSHGVQLITTVLSTKTYHKASLKLRDKDYDGQPLGKRSYALPWSLITLNMSADVDYRMTALGKERTEDVVAESISYISA